MRYSYIRKKKRTPFGKRVVGVALVLSLLLSIIASAGYDVLNQPGATYEHYESIDEQQPDNNDTAMAAEVEVTDSCSEETIQLECAIATDVSDSTEYYDSQDSSYDYEGNCESSNNGHRADGDEYGGDYVYEDDCSTDHNPCSELSDSCEYGNDSLFYYNYGYYSDDSDSFAPLGGGGGMPPGGPGPPLNVRMVSFFSEGVLVYGRLIQCGLAFSNVSGLHLSILADRPGYWLESWNTLPDGTGTVFTENTVINSNIEVFAQWTPNELVTVRFHADALNALIEGGLTATRSVRLGQNLTHNTPGVVMPADPIRPGYTFLGWFPAGSNVEFTALTPILNYVTLYARWGIEGINHLVYVTFDANGNGATVEGVAIVQRHVRLGQNLAFNSYGHVMPSDPNRPGYTFLGWFPAGSNEEFTRQTPILNHVTVYAHWVDIDVYVTVTFYANAPNALIEGGVTATRAIRVGQNLTYNSPGVVMPVDPIRLGYFFDGWFLAGSNEEFTALTVIKTHITVYARWGTDMIDHHMYVTFNANGNGATVEGAATVQRHVRLGQNLTYNTPGVGMPANPIRPGYTFIGWFPAGSNEEFTALTAIKTHITVYAQWIPGQLRVVTFNANGGVLAHDSAIRQVLDGQTLDNNTTGMSMPSEPTFAGYVFVQWVDEYGNPFNSGTAIIRDKTVSAQWEANPQVSVTFNANGGVLQPGTTPQSVRIGQTLHNNTTGAVMPADPSRLGYIFQGWFPAGSNEEFTALTLVTTHITVYAHWIEDIYATLVTITFNANGGVLAHDSETRLMFSGQTLANNTTGVSMPNPPTRVGHIFIAWNTLPDGTGTVFSENTVINAHIEVFAQWTPNESVTVRFYANSPFASVEGATYVERAIPMGQSMLSNSSGVNQMPQIPLWPMHVFVDWNTLPCGNGKLFDATQAIYTDKNVYAIWVDSGSIVRVYFVANGVGASIEGEAQVYRYVTPGRSFVMMAPHEHSTMPANAIRPGYTFVGWATADGAEFTENTMVLQTTRVYAQWTPNERVTVTFNANGGTLNGSASQQVQSGQSLAANSTSAYMPASPSRNGYTFSHWVDGDGNVFTGDTAVTEPTVLYVQWLPRNDVTVTFSGNVGTLAQGGESRTIREGQTLSSNTTNATMPGNPTRAGHSFQGWNTSPAGTGAAFDGNTVVTANITVYARWQASGSSSGGSGGSSGGSGNTGVGGGGSGTSPGTGTAPGPASGGTSSVPGPSGGNAAATGVLGGILGGGAPTASAPTASAPGIAQGDGVSSSVPHGAGVEAGREEALFDNPAVPLGQGPSGNVVAGQGSQQNSPYSVGGYYFVLPAIALGAPLPQTGVSTSWILLMLIAIILLGTGFAIHFSTGQRRTR